MITSKILNKYIFLNKANGIKESQIFVCLITDAYHKSDICNREIEYATTLKKKMIVLMIEKLRIEDLGGVGFIIK